MSAKDFFWWIIMAVLFLEDCKTIDSGGYVQLRWSEANLLKHFQENFGRGSLYLVQYFEIFCSILKPFGRGFLFLVQYCNGFTGKSLQCWAATVFPFSTISNATATTLCTNAVGTVIKKAWENWLKCGLKVFSFAHGHVWYFHATTALGTIAAEISSKRAD